MGKKYVIDETTLTNIADKIRDYLDTPNKKIYAEDLDYSVDVIYEKGNADGKQVGYEAGHTDGYNEGHTAGKQAEYDAFWDAFQNYGKKQKYDGTFRNVDSLDWNQWRKETLRPKYDIVPTSASYMFYGVSGIADLGEHFQELGIKLDFSKCNSFNLSFCYGSWVNFPALDCSNATAITGMFNYCSKLETIEKWIMSEKVTTGGACFVGCNNLKNIVVEGMIGLSTSFVNSPLTVESMLSIITHLKDYSGTSDAGKYTLTLKDTCKTLMAEQGAIAELGGKTYDQYITDIGWNLA